MRKPPATRLYNPLEHKQVLLKELKILGKMERAGRPQRDDNGQLFRIDSVVSSAYNSDKDDEWAQYEQPVLAPKNSRIQFQEDFQLISSNPQQQSGEQNGDQPDQRRGFDINELNQILQRSISPSDQQSVRKIMSSQSKRVVISPREGATRKQMQSKKQQETKMKEELKNQEQTKKQEQIKQQQQLKRQTSAGIHSQTKENVIAMQEGFQYDTIPFHKIKSLRRVGQQSKYDYHAIIQIQIIEDVKSGQLEIIFEQLCKQLGIFSAKIMKKLRGDQILQLARYVITAPICKAFTNIVPLMQYLKQISLKQNNLSDQSGSLFLRAAYQLQYINKFSYNKNVVGPKFALALSELMPAKPKQII